MKPIVIVGGGLAGLTCASYLNKAQKQVLILEKEDHIGGRVWSDIVDGFILDRGFQVFLDSYPEAIQCLDYHKLDLHKFLPGASILTQSGFKTVVDPFRSPVHILDTIFSRVFNFRDIFRVLRLKKEVEKLHRIDNSIISEQNTREFLVKRKFSEKSINEFFKPFFSGVFLEKQLDTTSDMFIFLFKMFSIGSACLPAQGMRAIPLELARQLPKESLQRNTRVSHLESNKVFLSSGKTIEAESVVLATDYNTTASLLGIERNKRRWRSTTNLYYRAPNPPTNNPILFVNGTGRGIINNISVPTNVCSSYSSTSEALISINVIGNDLGDDTIISRVQNELADWFGESSCEWEFLKSYRIPYSLPAEFGAKLKKQFNREAKKIGVKLVGDYLFNPSINGAMASGREVAENLIATGESI